MAGAKFVVSEAPKLPHSLIQAECSAGVNTRHVIIIAPLTRTDDCLPLFPVKRKRTSFPSDAMVFKGVRP
jgi:hypothetical protein